MICSPSFLTADFKNLKQEIESINEAKWLHFDVMDGVFVENKTYNHEVVKEIKKYSKHFFDVHLMTVDPKETFMNYVEAGADLVTFHYEVVEDAIGLINEIKANGVKAGISIKPDTDVLVLESLLPYLDLILIMSVEPGKGGQKFIENSLEKIAYLDKLRQNNKYNYLIEVDGGINFETARQVKAVGNDVIVVGSFIFNQANRNQLIGELENV